MSDPTPKRDLPTLEQLLENRRTRNRGLAEFFACGRWACTLESLGKALEKFAGDVPLIDGFPFTLEELTHDQTPCSKRWIFGCQFSLNHPADANSGFEGWPYGYVAAREAPGALVVEFTYGRPYQAATQEYLRRLLDALARASFVVEGGQIAAQREADEAMARMRAKIDDADMVQAQAQSEPKQGAVGKGGKTKGSRRPDYERHKAIWDAVAARWNQFHNYGKCRALLIDKHPNLLKPGRKGLTISDKTLKTIIEDGLANVFSHPLQS